jgi:hypothetical protein
MEGDGKEQKAKEAIMCERWYGHTRDFAQFVHLKGPLEVADSLAETGSRATHQSEARMPVQPITRQLVKTQQTEKT